MVKIMKKFIYCFISLLIVGMLSIPNVHAAAEAAPIEGGGTTKPTYNIGSFDPNKDDAFDSNCKDFANVIRIGGYLLFLAKVLIPLVIIVKASLSFVSVVTSGKPDDLKKKAQKVVTSLIAAIAIFFLPTIVYTVFGFIDSFDKNMTEDSQVCRACIFEPFNTKCSQYADKR